MAVRQNRVLIKKTEESGKVPTVNDLLPGELAINVADGKIFALRGTPGLYEVVEFVGIPMDDVSNPPPTSGVSIQGLTLSLPTGTSNEERYPAYGLYDYSHTMFIIRADEIGSGQKIITGLEIEMAGYNPNYTFYNQTIKLAHTSDLEFGSNVNVNLNGINNLANITEVKTNFDWTINSNGYQSINFDTNFEYNGTDSLLIIWENRDGMWGSGFGWAECHFDNTYYDSWYKYQDNTYPNGPGTRDQSYRPNLKLKY